MSKKVDTPDSLAKFLSQPRSVKEIAKRLRNSKLTEDQIRTLELPDGQALFEQKDSRDDSIFVVAEQRGIEVLTPRDWAIWVNPDHIPYIWIQFPSDCCVLFVIRFSGLIPETTNGEPGRKPISIRL